MTHEEALKDFEKQTVETQQSNLKSMKAHFMRKAGFTSNMAHMFKSQNLQYLNKNMENIIDLVHEDKTEQQALKNFALYNLLTPLLLTGIQVIINNMTGRKDKEPKEYAWFFFREMVSNILGLGLLGHSVNLAYSNYTTLHSVFWNLWGAITGSSLAWWERATLGRYDERKKRYKKTISKKILNGVKSKK
jgi:hypothetical protein